MRRLLPVSLLVLSACLSDTSAGPEMDTLTTSDTAAVPGIVLSFSEAEAGDSAALVALTSSVLGATDSTVEIRAFPAAAMVWVRGLTGDELLRVAEDPRVGSAEPVPVSTAEQSTTSWALDRLDQARLPLNGSYVNSFGAGAGARVYIFDTGLKLDHAEFASRASFGADLVEPRLSSPADCNGHGTLSASATGGTTLGTARSVSLIDVRVLGCTGAGSGIDFLEGVEWLLAERRANTTVPMIANMSLGFRGGWTAADEAVARLVAAGVHVVAAAGNSNEDACGTSPARVPVAITVGATANNDARASFSNFGNCVDVYAPGDNVVGAALGSTTATRNWSGTSAAAPYVAGLLATYLASRAAMTPAEVHANIIGGASGVVTGGSPNRLAYASFVAPPPAPAPPPPRANLTVTCVSRRCTANVANATRQPPVTAREVSPAGGLRGVVTPTATGASWRFAAPGRYTVTANATHGGSGTSITTRTVNVTDKKPSLSSTRVTCAAGVCTYSVVARDDEAVVSVSWAFSNGATATGTSGQVTIQAPGKYSATVSARDSLNQLGTSRVNFTVINGAPTARLVARCSGRTCTLDASTSTDDGGIAQYRFNGGAGGADITSANATQVVTYDFAGTYRASVVVTDRTGLTSRVETSVTVQ